VGISRGAGIQRDGDLLATAVPRRLHQRFSFRAPKILQQVRSNRYIERACGIYSLRLWYSADELCFAYCGKLSEALPTSGGASFFQTTATVRSAGCSIADFRAPT
jgi:hypothetical protein